MKGQAGQESSKRASREPKETPKKKNLSSDPKLRGAVGHSSPPLSDSLPSVTPAGSFMEHTSS
eukprot:1780068-Karenia_brevis.AAC.1